MKTKFKLQLNLNSPSTSQKVRTPEIQRRMDYLNSPVLDSPKSIKHRISIIKVEKLTDEMLINAINCHK